MPALARRFWLPLGLSIACVKPPPGTVAPVSCVVAPAPGGAPIERVRIGGTDPARLARFVRQDPGPTFDCEGVSSRRPVLAPPTEVVSLPAGSDLRDPLDRGAVDLLLTRDPKTADYARGLPRFRVLPLPSDLVYVLAGGPETTHLPSDAERRALARDVLAGDARAAVGTSWWRGPNPGCTAPGPPTASTVLRYPVGDPVARALAERLVALTTLREPPAWLAATFPVAQRSGLKIASTTTGRSGGPIVLGYPREAPLHCDGAGFDPAAIPLVETHEFLIVAEGVPAFEILADGTIRFVAIAKP